MNKSEHRTLLIILPIIIILNGCIEPLERKKKDVRGLYERHYDMAYNRLIGDGIEPVFTKDFILGDVNINHENPRRFTNYSGDLSGRYVEVLSRTVKSSDEAFLHEIVKEIISYQQTDGRFGDPGLNFQDEDITGEHMALLWGNGRMLVGLMEYYNRFDDKIALIAAKKLGDFYLSTYALCATPETVEKLDGFGAKGFICFTQYIEGMVSLAKATGDEKYADVCSNIYPLLPPRGEQHAHGVITTWRGILSLYEQTGNPTYLDYVKSEFDDLINSSDYTIFGSVGEFFGGRGERDEGCATADFVRLSLGLYHNTGERKYLEIGEYALYNSLYFNQYKTGDFGHQILVKNRSEVYDHDGDHTQSFSHEGAASSYQMASWWCCTMHGLRTLESVNDYVFNLTDNQIKVDLFTEGDFMQGDNQLRISFIGRQNDLFKYKLVFNLNSKRPISLRIPDWAEVKRCMIGGDDISGDIKDGYIKTANSFDRVTIELTLKYKISLVDINRNEILVNKLKSGTHTGVLKYGPYLMGIDDNADPEFTAEPNDNVVYINTVKPTDGQDDNPMRKIYIAADYRHSGFPSRLSTTFRPIAALSFEKRPYLMLSLNFEK